MRLRWLVMIGDVLYAGINLQSSRFGLRSNCGTRCGGYTLLRCRQRKNLSKKESWLNFLLAIPLRCWQLRKITSTSGSCLWSRWRGRDLWASLQIWWRWNCIQHFSQGSWSTILRRVGISLWGESDGELLALVSRYSGRRSIMRNQVSLFTICSSIHLFKGKFMRR